MKYIIDVIRYLAHLHIHLHPPSHSQIVVDGCVVQELLDLDHEEHGFIDGDLVIYQLAVQELLETL